MQATTSQVTIGLEGPKTKCTDVEVETIDEEEGGVDPYLRS